MPERPGVAVTRAEEDAAPLVAALEAVGLRAVCTPLLQFAPSSPDPLVGELADALTALRADGASTEWLVCTSRHAVTALAHSCGALGIAPASLNFAQVGAVGRRTAEALEAIGVPVTLVPDVSDAAHLAAAMLSRSGGVPARVLFPRAREAREAMPTALRYAGWEVNDVTCYETLPSADGATRLAAALSRGELGAVTLASGSAARAFSQCVPAALWGRARLVSIGATTTADATACALPIAAQATEPTVAALADATRRILSESFAHA